MRPTSTMTTRTGGRTILQPSLPTTDYRNCAWLIWSSNLEVLVENGLEDAVMRFVEKDDKDAIKE
jgi:hypothetical protein